MVWFMIALLVVLSWLAFVRDTSQPIAGLRAAWQALAGIAAVQAISNFILAFTPENAFEITSVLNAISWALAAWAVFSLGLSNSQEASPSASSSASF